MAPERGLVTYVSAVSKMISEEPERAVIIPAFNGEGTVKSVVNSVKRVTTSSVRPSIIIQPTARRQRPHRQVLASSDCQSSWAPRAPFRWPPEAARQGCRCVVTMDSDGQHNPRDLVKLIESIEINSVDVVLGACPGKGSSLRRFA